MKLNRNSGRWTDG